MDSILRDRLTLIAALGTGVVVGISGIYLYYKLNRSVTRELSNLAGTIEGLRREIEELKSSGPLDESCKHNKRSSPEKHPSVSNHASNSSSTEDAEEYYDFTDAEETIASWTSFNGVKGQANGPTIEITPCDSGAGDGSWFDQIDFGLDSSADKEALYRDLLTKKEEYENDASFLWRLAKATHLCGISAQKNGDLKKKRDLSFEAFSYAKEALEADEKNPEVHKWYAITIGSLGEFIGVQEKIKNGYEFKQHVDTAVKLKPEDPTLHHMLGRWCYEVATLSWIERKLASTLYASPPESTFQEARAHLFEADKLKSTWKENMLFIAKTYIGEGNYSPAISWIDRAIQLPCQGEDDEVAQKELESLQHQYQGYRS